MSGAYPPESGVFEEFFEDVRKKTPQTLITGLAVDIDNAGNARLIIYATELCKSVRIANATGVSQSFPTDSTTRAVSATNITDKCTVLNDYTTVSTVGHEVVISVLAYTGYDGGGLEDETLYKVATTRHT